MISIDPNRTIQKTLTTVRLFDGFWDRWIAHGMEKEVISQVKVSVRDISDWTNYFNYHAQAHTERAMLHKASRDPKKAEKHFQLAGLYYNLMQWIYPDANEEKVWWYKKSIDSFKAADQFSNFNYFKEQLTINGGEVVGRVRPLENPKGIIIIVNPIDSSKEELFTYEKHFLELGYLTISFDGPGQGETYIFNRIKATRDRWEQFLNVLIDYASEKFPNLPIFLFGTSSGARWSIAASRHPMIKKAIAVSPAISEDISLPEYFVERTQFISDQSSHMLPDIHELTKCKPIFVFHGNKDVMVRDKDIYQLYHRLPSGKKLVVYEEETHCCNGKLKEIRAISANWLMSNEEGKT
ncbi:alpha/beta hydrolase [Gracilibacillus xinjiangensis]|uniref:Alpha/beta hydrolase n=1 Tax=Gracilibacillus xinjiangensis TaxID=1193282 RepID=A0ABV8WQB2_9BACI